MKTLLLLVAIPFFSLGKIMPEIVTPDKFNGKLFEQIKTNNYLADTSGCGVISLKIFHPPGHNKYPSDPYLCLYAVDAINNGYGPGQVLPEEVYFDKKTGQWKKKKYILSKESIQRSLDVYGISSLSELQPVELYNIQSVNARGYAVINSNIPLREKRKGVKKNLSFCLIHDDFAFCGYGPMAYDGKEIDFTPYMLKSLETVEMGLSEKPAK